MQQFFKFTFASCLGVFLAGILFFIVLVGAASASGSGEGEKKEVKSGSVLEINLEESFPELTNNVESSSPFSISSEKKVGLHDLCGAITRASNDPKIKGIVINTKYLACGYASASSLRKALIDFKTSKKFVVSYADYYTQGGYYLSSVADKIFLNPQGVLDFRGLSSQTPFFKDMLDRAGIKVQVYYAGQFKSATEPFRYNQMSPQNKLQVREYMGGLYNNMLTDISKSRGISVAELDNISNNLLVRQAGDALKYKMVDSVGYYDQALSTIYQLAGVKGNDKLPVVSLKDYAQSYSKEFLPNKNKIAVVYAEGNIELADNNDKYGIIEGNHYAKIFRKLRQDKEIKAIVLRINSGGGSALASDIMYRELDLAKKAGKTIVVSMGDVAASGGYYIAAPADSIFAQANTITGSIGVFSLLPSFQRMAKDKFGVSFDTVKTGKYSASYNTFYDVNDDEGKLLQMSTDSIYDTFLSRVAAGRHKTKAQIHEVAQGRVWTGAKALEIGLVDRIGSLDDAILAAARKAGIADSYKTAEYPKIAGGLNKILENLMGKKNTTENLTKLKQQAIEEELGDLAPYYIYLKQMRTMKGAQMRIPYLLDNKF
jgi:protease IV